MAKHSERNWSPRGFAYAAMRLLLLTVLLLSGITAGAAQTVSLAWDRSADANVAGYRVYMGTTSGNYLITNNVGQATSATVSGLQAGDVYYFVVTAYSSAGVESAPSNEIVYLVPDQSPRLQISVASGAINLKFTALSGKTYVVEYKDSLDEVGWNPLTTLGDTNGIVTLSYSTPGTPSRFYRVGVR